MGIGGEERNAMRRENLVGNEVELLARGYEVTEKLTRHNTRLMYHFLSRSCG